MKRLILVASFLFVAAGLKAQEDVVFDAATANCDPCINTGTNPTGIYDLTGATKVSVQFSSASGSDATCSVYTKATLNDPWGLAFFVTAPAADEPFWLGPGAGYIKLSISNYVSGTLRGTIKRTK